MNIYLVRHGQTDFNKNGRFQGTTDVPLNPAGILQAEAIGKRLESKGINTIYASDHKRVLQTAEIINSHLLADIVVREELREINMGEWESLNHENIRLQYGAYYEEWLKHEADIAYPKGECGADVERRALRVVNEIISAGQEENLVVTSGGTIRALLCSFLGMQQAARFSFDTDNCGLSIVRYERKNNKYYIKCINDTSHIVLT